MNNKENMIRLKQQGYSYAVIGVLYGITRQRVHQLISGYHRNNKGLKDKGGWYRQIRNRIIQRDGGRCQKCGATKNLVIHHLDGDDNNNAFPNLITLCNECHLTLHRPDGWDIYRNDGKKKLTEARKKPLKPSSEPQGKGIKRFFVELLGRIKR